jgi:hypothetical protein
MPHRIKNDPLRVRHVYAMPQLCEHHAVNIHRRSGYTRPLGVAMIRIPIGLSLLCTVFLLGVSCRTRYGVESTGRLGSKGFEGRPATVDEALGYLPLREKGHFAPIARKTMRTDTMWRVANARVLIADYDLIRRDFPVLKNRSEADIRDWLVEQTGFISDLQTHPIHHQSKIEGTSLRDNPYQTNSIIPLRQPEQWQRFHKAWMDTSVLPASLERSEVRKAILSTRPRCVPTNGVNPERCSLRPMLYERAVVLPVYWERQQVGLVDIKGAGISDTRAPAAADDHASGLLATGEALREYFLSKLVSWILDRATIFPPEQLKLQALGHYAVIDLGFADQWKDAQGQATFKPAGLLLRQAHNRDDYFGRMIAPTTIVDEEGNLDFEDLEEDEGVKGLPQDYAATLFPASQHMKIAHALFAAGITTDTHATNKPNQSLKGAAADIQFALNLLPTQLFNPKSKKQTVVSLVDFGSFGFVSYHDRKVKETFGLEPIFANDYSLKNSIYGWGPQTQWRPHVTWLLPDGRSIDLSGTQAVAAWDGLSRIFFELAEHFKVPLQGYSTTTEWKASETRAHDHMRDIFVAFEQTIKGNLKTSWRADSM